MSDASADLERILPIWVGATKNIRIPVPESASISERLQLLRPLTKERLRDLDVQPSDDEILSILSLLSMELVNVKEPSEVVLSEADAAVSLLSNLELPSDCFGELPELLCRFAFVAWRHARALERPRVSQQWLELFDQTWAQGLVDRESIAYFLATLNTASSPELNSTFLFDSEALFSLCAVLREMRNESPGPLSARLTSILEWVGARFWPDSFRDEREYFLAQLESSAGVCARWLGNREEALTWFDRAESRYSNMVDRENGSAEVDLLRLVTRYEMGQYREVLTALPRLQESCRRVGAAGALLKSDLLLSSTLKGLGRIVESVEPLQRALGSPLLSRDGSLRAFVLAFLADSYTLQGRIGEAQRCIQEAMGSLRGLEMSTAAPFLRLVVGEGFRVQGEMEKAVDAYREARQSYDGLKLEAWAAYARLLTAEALLLLGRDREAEAEILAALPTIESHKLVREGLSAIALLRESIRRRKTDRNALRELRERLQGKH